MSGDALPRDLSFPSGTSLADTFRYTARQYADDIAVVAGSWQVRYAELDAWSDALCGQLLAAGGTSPWVAIAGVAHPGAIAAILGILKAGRGYLAIGVSGHSDQPQRILAHSGADRVLAAPGSPLARAAAALPAVRALDPVAPPAADAANLNGLAPAGDAAAYLAYTSGSTGTPKGVIQSHAAVLASVAAMRGMDLFRPGERVALLTPLTFGAASQELFGTLLSGGTLCVYDADDPDSGTVSEWLARVRPDTVVSVPSRARTWVPQPDLGLRNLLVGAERLYGRDLDHLRKLGGSGCRIWYTYGASETKLVAALDITDRSAEGVLPVGRPVPGMAVSVRDADGQALAAGQSGEIWIRGPSLASGYWGDPERMAAHFVTREGRRWYRSGDIGRLREDGVLEYAGRSDDMVKVSGQSVCVIDVEAVLRDHPGVAETVAVAFEDNDGSTRIGAAIEVARPPAIAPSRGDLRAAVAEVLPAAAIPSRLWFSDRLPRSPNGKLDRVAIRSALQGMAEGTPAGMDLTLPMERAVAEVWAEVLGQPVTSADADFFALGGTSLKTSQLCLKLNARFGSRFTPLDIVRAATIQEQLAHIGRRHSSRTAITESDRLAIAVAGDPDAPPLYLFPGGDGELEFQFTYRTLARELGSNYRVHAVIPDRLLAGGAGPTVEDVAAVLAEELRGTRPGPLFFVGLCGGTTFAWDTARRLPDRDVRLILVSPLWPGSRIRHALWRAGRIRIRAGRYVRIFSTRVGIHARALWARSPRQWVAYLRERLASNRTVAATGAAAPAEVSRARAVERARARLKASTGHYRPAPWAGQVVLYVPTDRRFLRYAQRWRGHARSAAEVRHGDRHDDLSPEKQKEYSAFIVDQFAHWNPADSG